MEILTSNLPLALKGNLKFPPSSTIPRTSVPLILCRVFPIALLAMFAPHHANSVEVTYTMQTGNNAATFTDSGATFNESATQMGMWANGGNNDVVAWRNFRTNGTNGGSARDLQIGDLFTITVNATSAFGSIGLSLNDGGTQGGSFANRISGSRLQIYEAGTGGSWTVNTGSDTSLGYNVSSTRREYTFKIYITSATTANVQLAVNGSDVNNRAYNVTLAGSAGANIDAFSMWLDNDWNGSANANIFWQQETSVEDLGSVDLGYYMTSGTFDPGQITNGLAADSTTTARVNAVNIGGDSGTAVLMNQDNTYTGATMINNAATARLSHATGFGTTAGGVTVSNGGMLEISGGITVGAEALSLNGVGISSAGAVRNTAGNNSWAGAVTLASNSRINSDAGNLTFSGAVGGGSNVLFMGGSGNNTLSGILSGAGNTQDTTTTSLYKDGAGALTLSGANTYTGDTRIAAGNLIVASGGSLGSGSDVFIKGGASLTINASTTVASFQEWGSSDSGTISVGTGAVLTMNGANRGAIYQNAISGDGGITMAGTGTSYLILFGSNTYTGTTTVSSGTLGLGGAGTTIAGNLAISGGLVQYQNSTNNQIADTSDVTITSGTLAFGARTETIDSLTMSGGNITIGSGTLGLAAASSFTGGNTTLSATGSRLNTTGLLTLGEADFVYDNASANTQGLTLGGDIAVNDSTTVDFTNALAGAGRINLNESTRSISVGTGANMNVGWIIAGTTGTPGITKTGAGTLTLSGANSFNGPVTINAGTLSISDVANGGTASNLGAGTTDAARLVLGGGTLLFTGASDSTDRNFTLTAATTSTINVSNGATTLTLSGNAASSTGSLTKAGSGTLSLTNQNLYTGTTTVNAGTLSLGHATNTLNNSSSVVVSGGTLALGANTDTVSAFTMSSGEVSGGTLTASTYALSGGTVSGALGAGTATVTGAVSLTGTMVPTTLNINSGGNLTLGSSDRIGTGAVDINAGILSMGSNNDTVGAITLRGNGTIGGTGTLTGSSYALQNGTVNANLGTGTITVTDSLTVLNGTVGSTTINVNGGNLTLGAANRLADGATVTVAGGILNSGANADTVTALNMSSGSILGSGTLTATTYALSGGTMAGALGAGTANITNTVSLTGTMASTTINILNTGNLSLGSADRIANATNVDIASGGVLTLGGFNETVAGISGAGNIALGSATLTTNFADSRTLSGVISGASGALTKQGAGTLILSGNSTYTGATTISAGTLQLGAGGNSGNVTSDITNNSALVIDRGNNFTYGNIISGSGTLTKNGSGTLTLSTTNTMSGNTTVNAGGLTLNNASGAALGGNITVAGGTLTMSSTNQTASGKTVTMTSGSMVVQSTQTFGSLVMSGGNMTRQGGNLTLSGASNFTGGNVSFSAGTSRIGTSGTTTLGDVNFITGSTISSGNGLVLGGNVLMTSGTANFTLTAGSGRIDLGSSDRTFDLGTGTALNSNWAIVGTGGLTKSGAGTMTLNATNTYTGNTTVTAGTLATSGANQISTSTSLDVQGGTFQLGGNQQFNSVQGAGNINLGANTLTLGSNNLSTTISGTISGASGALTKEGSGTLTLSANNTYSGATTVSAGTLVISGTNTNSAITVSSGATLGGTGRGGNTVVSGTIAPGTSPGILTVGDLTLNSGGAYTWEMADATGVAGTGWDQIVATGLLTVSSTSTPGSTFTINITSTGSPTNWSKTTGRTWDIIDYNTISGFDPLKFTLNTASFQGDVDGGSSWSLSDTGSVLRLTYSYTAGTPTWTGGTGNWGDGFTPAISNGLNAIFTGAGGTATNNITSSTLTNIGSLTFNSTAGAYTLAANAGTSGVNSSTPLTINGDITNNSTSTQTINLALSYAANENISANSGNIAIGGAVAIASGQTVTVQGGNNTTMSGAVTGAGAISKAGAGTLTLSGGNSFSGGVAASEGTILVGSNTALGSGNFTTTGSVTIASTDSTARVLETSYTSLSGSSVTVTFGQASGGTGALTFNGTSNLSIGSGSRTLQVLNTTTLMGGITGASGSIVKTGAGTLILNGANSYTGATTINAGILQIGNGGTTGSLSTSSTITNNAGLVFNQTDTVTQGTDFANNIGGTGTLTQNGSGTLALNTSNSYTGATTINTGIIRASNATALGTTAGGVTVASGAALELSGGITIGAESLSLSGTGNGGANGALRNISGDNTYQGAITLAAASRINSDSGSGNLTGGISGTNTNLDFGGAGITRVQTTGINLGAGALTKNGSGALWLETANTYSGGTSLSLGTLRVYHGNALGSGAVTQTGGTLQIRTSSAISNDMNLTNLALYNSSNLTGSITTGTTLTITTENPSQNLISGNISGAGGLNISIGGGASITLTGSNTYLGNTVLNNDAGGILQIGNGGTTGSLGTAGSFTIDDRLVFNRSNTVTQGTDFANNISGTGSLTQNGTGTLILSANNTYTGATTINAGILQIGAGGTTGALSTSSAITNNTGLVFNQTDTVTQGTDFANNIGGTGTLTQNGSGTLFLNTGNSYTGATTINTGIIRASNATALGTTAGGVTVASGAALELIGGITIGAEALNLSGTGNGGANGALRNISGDNTYGGAITLAAATRINSDAGLLTLSGAIGGAGQNLTIGGAGNTAISNAIGTTTGTLTKADAGTLRLSGANTFSGGITLSAGTLMLQNASAAGSGTLTQSSAASLLTIDTTGTLSNTMSLYNVSALQSATLNGSITVNNATFDVESGDTLTLSGGVGGTGGVTKNGTGTLVLSGSNTYSGATVVNAGTLNAAHANALGTNASVTVNNGGSLLVSADDAINGRAITLASTSTTVAGLAFSGTFANTSGQAGTLTLSQNSILDLGTGSVVLHFSSITGLDTYTLSIYNWTGTTLWNGGTGGGTDQFYSNGTALTQSQLNRISFYSGGLGTSSFIGSGYQIIGGSFANEVIPVPEPETYATAVVLLLGGAFWTWRRRTREPSVTAENLGPSRCKV